MNIQRLKFAQARGARIQWQNSTSLMWSEAWAIYLSGDRYSIGEGDHLKWRIHPDDAHLEYGPISSALRHRAVEGISTRFKSTGSPASSSTPFGKACGLTLILETKCGGPLANWHGCIFCSSPSTSRTKASDYHQALRDYLAAKEPT